MYTRIAKYMRMELAVLMERLHCVYFDAFLEHQLKTESNILGVIPPDYQEKLQSDKLVAHALSQLAFENRLPTDWDKVWVKERRQPFENYIKEIDKERPKNILAKTLLQDRPFEELVDSYCSDGNLKALSLNGNEDDVRKSMMCLMPRLMPDVEDSDYVPVSEDVQTPQAKQVIEIFSSVDTAKKQTVTLPTVTQNEDNIEAAPPAAPPVVYYEITKMQEVQYLSEEDHEKSNQKRAARLLKAGYKYIDVESDGHCGYYACLLGLYHIGKRNWTHTKTKKHMLQFRQSLKAYLKKTWLIFTSGVEETASSIHQYRYQNRARQTKLEE